MPGDSPVAARTISLVKDPTGAPAVNLSKVREAGHVDLVKRAEKAGISLSKRNMSGLRGAVRLYVDHSGSMEFPNARDYSNGNVQRLVERALGYAFQLDSDGKIPVIAFDHRLWPEVVVDQSNYEGIVEARIWHADQMGGTKFSPVLEDLLNEARTTAEPIFAIIVTDGSPSDPVEATMLVIRQVNPATALPSRVRFSPAPLPRRSQETIRPFSSCWASASARIRRNSTPPVCSTVQQTPYHSDHPTRPGHHDQGHGVRLPVARWPREDGGRRLSSPRRSVTWIVTWPAPAPFVTT